MAELDVPTDNIPALRAKIARLARRAVRLGLVEPVLSEGDPFIREIRRTNADRPTPVQYTPVTVKGPEVVLPGGWRVVAVVEHLGDGDNVVTSCITGADVPEEWRTAAPDCAHCGLDRRRRTTVLVTGEGGETQQVGKSCLKDFVGHLGAEDLAARAQWLRDLAEACDPNTYGHSGNTDLVYTAAFLKCAAAVVRVCGGYISRARAERDLCTSTADLAVEAYLGKSTALRVDITPEDEALAARAHAYVQTLRDLQSGEATLAEAREQYPWFVDGYRFSDFEHNLAVVASREAFRLFKHAGIVSAAVVAFVRTAERYATWKAEEDARPSNWVGRVKEKVEMALTFQREIRCEGTYGVSHLCIFRDEANNLVKWFASNRFPFEVGQTYVIRGTVKGHDEYRGVKQTAVTRCKVLGLAGVEAPELPKRGTARIVVRTANGLTGSPHPTHNQWFRSVMGNFWTTGPKVVKRIDWNCYEAEGKVKDVAEAYRWYTAFPGFFDSDGVPAVTIAIVSE